MNSQRKINPKVIIQESNEFKFISGPKNEPKMNMKIIVFAHVYHALQMLTSIHTNRWVY